MSELSHFGDCVVAEALDKLNWVACHIPPLAQKIGIVDSLTSTPVRWRHIVQRATDPELRRDFLRAGKDKTSGLVPATYNGVAVMRFNRQWADTLVQSWQGAKLSHMYLVNPK